MATYQSPQDEGYSEDPLTLQTSSGVTGSTLMEHDIPSWLSEMPVAERARMSAPKAQHIGVLDIYEHSTNEGTVSRLSYDHN
jgi:hypothetical protein